MYVPTRYYRREFYLYAYQPWAVPVFYHWGWYRSAWYGFYGPVFAPYAFYAGPRYWLTDYVISSELESAFDSQPPPEQVISYASPITREIKEAISQEVQRQLELAQQQPDRLDSNSSVERSSLPIFDNSSHTLLVSTNLNVVSTGQTCSITPGDIVQISGAPPSGPLSDLPVRVYWSKPSDCAAGSTVTIAAEQLQEMQNQMRASIDQGLADMQNSSGQNGMTNIPTNLIGSTPASFASDAPGPEPNISEELKQQAAEGFSSNSFTSAH